MTRTKEEDGFGGADWGSYVPTPIDKARDAARESAKMRIARADIARGRADLIVRAQFSAKELAELGLTKKEN